MQLLPWAHVFYLIKLHRSSGRPRTAETPPGEQARSTLQEGRMLILEAFTATNLTTV
jgi:hypothetical protein